MLPTAELFVYVLVHDLMLAGAIVVPGCPGAPPACSDAELPAIAVVRHLPGRRSESGFLAEVGRDRGRLFPALPCQSEANRRTRWLWGAFEQLRITLAARLPEDDCQQVDTSALPVKHPSRVRGPDQWTGPGNDLAARFGRDAAVPAHARVTCRNQERFLEPTREPPVLHDRVVQVVHRLLGRRGEWASIKRSSLGRPRCRARRSIAARYSTSIRSRLG